jgi:hypothetical protein
VNFYRRFIDEFFCIVIELTSMIGAVKMFLEEANLVNIKFLILKTLHFFCELIWVFITAFFVALWFRKEDLSRNEHLRIHNIWHFHSRTRGWLKICYSTCERWYLQEKLWNWWWRAACHSWEHSSLTTLSQRGKAHSWDPYGSWQSALNGEIIS